MPYLQAPKPDHSLMVSDLHKFYGTVEVLNGCPGGLANRKCSTEPGSDVIFVPQPIQNPPTRRKSISWLKPERKSTI